MRMIIWYQHWLVVQRGHVYSEAVAAGDITRSECRACSPSRVGRRRGGAGRRDDLWSWLYLLVEMVTGTLPWRSEAGGPRDAVRDKELAVRPVWPRTSRRC